MVGVDFLDLGRIWYDDIKFLVIIIKYIFGLKMAVFLFEFVSFFVFVVLI